MLNITHLTKGYGAKPALVDLTLSFEPGLVYALVGPNGSGKSTLMKTVAGLVKPTSGSVTFHGQPLSDESRARIAYMSTEPFYYESMRIRDVGRFHRDFFPDFREERFAALLQEMALTPDQKVKSLSSGMAAKLKIAVTLSRDAEIVMLDEPLNGIDLIGRDQIVAAVRRAIRPGVLFLLSSHLLDELEPLADCLVMLKDGQLVLEGRMEDIRERYSKSMVELYREVYTPGSQFTAQNGRDAQC